MAEETNTNVNAELENAPAGTETNTPTFDDILQDKGYQAEFDRRIAKALDTARKKWEGESRKADEGKSAGQEHEEPTQAEMELARREKEITRRELRADAIEKLAEKGLPAALADVLVYSDAETCNQSMRSVEKAFRAAVENAVNDRLRSESPKTGGEPPAVTKEQFDAMTYMQRAELFASNRKLYDELTGGD